MGPSRGALATFEFVLQLENIKMSVPAGVKVRFLKLVTADGFNSNAALWEPQEKKPNFAFLYIHGSAGNYAAPMMTLISNGLGSKGHAATAINTRQHYASGFKDNLYDIP